MLCEKATRSLRTIKKYSRGVSFALLFGTAGVLGGDEFSPRGRDLSFQKPNFNNYTETLSDGVDYELRVLNISPRQRLNIISIPDISKVGIMVTPPIGIEDGNFDTRAQTVSNMIRGLVKIGVPVILGVNGNFYEPGFPAKGEGVDILGLAVSNGEVYSDYDSKYPSVCFGDTVEIGVECEDDVQNALSGNQMLIVNGEVPEFDNLSVHPRTVIGVSEDGESIWIVIADGRVPRSRSRGEYLGATYRYIANILLGLGARNAVNVDGGGSSTMVHVDEFGNHNVLNIPVDRRDMPFYYPGMQRYVGNGLIIYRK